VQHDLIGYKPHLTGTCYDDSPLLYNVEIRIALEPDHDVTPIIYTHLVEHGYHLMNILTMSIDHLVSGQQSRIDLMRSIPDDNSWQARLNG
jgi:hypothetical protein